MNDFLQYRLNQQHHLELIERSARRGLIQKRNLRRPGALIAAIRVYRPALSQLGRILIAMGTSLQIRYSDAAPSKSSW